MDHAVERSRKKTLDWPIDCLLTVDERQHCRTGHFILTSIKNSRLLVTIKCHRLSVDSRLKASMISRASRTTLSLCKYLWCIPVTGIDPCRRPVDVVDEVGSAFEVAADVPSVG